MAHTKHNIASAKAHESFVLRRESKRLLDIASKAGEFAIALYKRYKTIDPNLDAGNLILSIPTSSHAYEFTRNVYAALGLNLDNITEKFNSYDLLKVKTADGEIDYGRIKLLLTQKKPFRKITMNDKVSTRGMNNIIAGTVGNPPYQEMNGSGGTNDAPIYQYFSKMANETSDQYSSLVIKAAWTSTGRESLIGPFRHDMISCMALRNMTNYIQADNVFPGTEIKGGICYFFRDKVYHGDCDYSLVQDGTVADARRRNLSEFDIIVRDPRIAEIVKKVMEKAESEGRGYVSSIISADTPFGIPTNPADSKKSPIEVSSVRTKDFDTALFYLSKKHRYVAYVKSKSVSKNHDDIKFDKVFIPGAYGAGEGFPHQILGMPEVAPKMSVCSQTYLYAKFDSHKEAVNFAAYLKTRFFRILVSAIKITQHAQDRVYRFVPMQDFSESWTDEKLYAKYGITKSEQQFIESLIKPME